MLFKTPSWVKEELLLTLCIDACTQAAKEYDPDPQTILARPMGGMIIQPANLAGLLYSYICHSLDTLLLITGGRLRVHAKGAAHPPVQPPAERARKLCLHLP